MKMIHALPVLLAATLALPASAQTTTAHKAAVHSTSTRQQGDTMESLVNKRIADLHSRLHITQDQSQQWEQFAQQMRDNARDIDQAYQQRAEKISAMSAVDNMQSFADIEQQRSQGMQKLVPAFQTLYASLSDQQKQTADQLFRNYSEQAQTHRQAAIHSTTHSTQ
jgi:periplasmic protein CpxP/Spy